MLPSVAIVILSWNRRDLTLNCLDSLGNLRYPADVLQVVVDNGSTDGTPEAVRAYHPEVIVLETGENLGYAEGNNVGIRHALEQGTEYVCLLNNDTIVAPDFLRAMIDEAESESDIGIVGPKMYCLEPSDMVFAAGSLIDWRIGDLTQRGIWQRENEVGSLYAASSEDVDFIIGCGVLLKRELIERIGLLDPRYYLNFEDVDWCVRARKAGYRVRYTPKAVLWHQVSASLGQASPRNTYYMTRNALLFFWTHLNGWGRWRAVIRIVVRNVGHIAVWTLKREYREKDRAKRDANILALRDALLGRFGKMGADVEAICRRS